MKQMISMLFVIVSMAITTANAQETVGTLTDQVVDTTQVTDLFKVLDWVSSAIEILTEDSVNVMAIYEPNEQRNVLISQKVCSGTREVETFFLDKNESLVQLVIVQLPSDCMDCYSCSDSLRIAVYPQNKNKWSQQNPVDLTAAKKKLSITKLRLIAAAK